MPASASKWGPTFFVWGSEKQWVACSALAAVLARTVAWGNDSAASTFCLSTRWAFTEAPERQRFSGGGGSSACPKTLSAVCSFGFKLQSATIDMMKFPVSPASSARRRSATIRELHTARARVRVGRAIVPSACAELAPASLPMGMQNCIATMPKLGFRRRLASFIVER